jgi:RNA polymerase sigma-70 factor (ECF subfamily)
LAVNHQLDRFLQSVERRAFVKARLATGNEQDALDIVQDAMFKLARKYSHRTPEDWAPLFQTILQSRITDWYRRQAVRNKLFAWLDKSSTGDEDSTAEAIDMNQIEPAKQLDTRQLGALLQQALAELPVRQQQAFLLRQWDGLSVEQTAQAMGCSSGSVKTHCSRAAQSLQKTLTMLGINEHTITSFNE